MSRLIIKNLPAKIKEEKLRQHFGSVGTITDCKLKYTKSGVFRKFAFIGYKTSTEANTALKQFNNTFIDASKVCIEIAKDLGDGNKSRPWSKYSNKIPSEQKGNKKSESKKKSGKEKKEKKGTEGISDTFDELKDDPMFHEFLKVHQNVREKQVWTNDGMTSYNEDVGKPKNDDDDDDDSGGDSDSDNDEDSSENVKKKVKVDKKTKGDKQTDSGKGMSDLDYLRSKMAGQDKSIVDDDSDSDNETKDSKKQKDASPEDNKEPKEKDNYIHMLKLKGLPVNCGEKAVKEFFHPLHIVKLNVIKTAGKKTVGTAYVGFKTQNELDQALRRNKNYIAGKKIYLKVAEKEHQEVVEPDIQPAWELKNDTEIINDVAETGRLFVRNLPYTCTEDDLEEEFKKFGPLTEVKLPMDQFTKKLKGFAFITFMMPEHAVKAYSELDGKVFQGRMLHIIPGREINESTEIETEGSSFKNKKKAKEKAMASSSHNWNSLFLGSNAVVDVLAEKYDAEKSDILDTNMKGSLGVRIALGETQLVQQTRDFLTEHGVSLDSFTQVKTPRSKTVILVKNLPAKTTVSEIEDLFSRYGQLGRTLLPPFGITAIVEFISQTEAKSAFTKLAYSKFHHEPLYLEWAPVEVFKSPPPEVKQVTETDNKSPEISVGKDVKKTAATVNDDDDEDDNETESVLFVKNLNFDTTDEGLKEHFSECRGFKTAKVALKKDLKRPGEMLSMGYGFVEFNTVNGAQDSIKTMQHTYLDGHTLELKVSDRTTKSSSSKQDHNRKGGNVKKQTTTKILVRNIPFEAKHSEIMELFKVFGELKFVRLPKKLGGSGSHRGFGFVDFLTKQDAKRAFEALCHSTHLYGRRLVLEWADTDDNIDDIRKRTAEQFHDGSSYGGKKFKKSTLMDTLDGTGGE
ncbi:putative RNA-binding protein 19 [Mactra antiquata]